MQLLLVELSFLLLITAAISLAADEQIVQVRHGGCLDSGCCGTNNWTCSSLVAAIDRVRHFGNTSQETHILLHNSQPPQPFILSPGVAVFKTIVNFTLQGFNEMVDILCDSGAGLSFIYSTNITFKNIRFVGCGALRNSTSRDLSVQRQDSFLAFRTALYFLFCADVTMLNVVVSQTNGTGVVLYSTVGQNTFTNSKFEDNAASGYPQGGGGGMTVEFVFCIPGDLTCFDKNISSSPDFYSSHASYIFSNCSFMQNRATTTNFSATAFTSSFQSFHVALGRGGGLSVFFKGTAHDNYFTINNCSFGKNNAVWGGGLLVEFEDSSLNNTMALSSTLFKENRCDYNPLTYNGTGGGGARVAFAGFNDRVKQNKVTMMDVHFKSNRAYFGGGVSFHTIPEDDSNVATNSIEFIDCSWTNNVARLGSALDFALYQERAVGAVAQPVLTNCVFEFNSIYYSNYSGIATGFGTIYADHVPLVFSQSFISYNNIGSGIVGLNSELMFTNNCVANFTSNTGHSGGAITLFGSGYIRVNDSTVMMFTNNTAELYGGAIFWQSEGNHELISSRNCFIRYSIRTLSPYKWPVKFIFRNNTAGLLGNSIYSTTLLTCLWGGVPFGVLRDPNEEYDQVFCWNDEKLIWDYGDDNCSTDIATSPGYFTEVDKLGNPYTSAIFPGQTLHLPVSMEDDIKHNVPDRGLVFTWMAKGSQHGYINRDLLLDNEEPRGSVIITLNTIQPRVLTADIIVNVTQCPTGFIYNHTTSTCTAAMYQFFETGLNYTAAIQRGYWIGYNQDRSALIAAQCFHCGYNPDLLASDYIPLPSNPEELDDFFCGALNRTGITCSRCRNGTGPGANSRFYPCVNCPAHVEAYSWLFFIGTEFVPNTLLLILVVLFNISVTSGPANAFIFFAQVISTTFGVDANGIIPFQSITPAADQLRVAYTAIYDIWNLNFFYGIRGWQFCLSPNLTALDLVAIGYITAFYPILILLLILVFAILYDRQNRAAICLIRPLHRLVSRFRQRWSFQRSITDAFATFIVLSFTKVAVNSQNILFANTVYSANGTEITTIALLYGDYEFQSKEFLPYFIVAIVIFVLICIVIPAIMLLYSIKPFYSCLNKLNLTFLLPGEKFKYFLNAFHYCYKDGTNGTYDLRFFAPLYFILRVLLIWTYGLAPTWTQQYVMQQVICTIGVLMFGVLQPYKNSFYNFLDSAFFALLATINILTMFNRYNQVGNLPLSATAYWIEIILIFAPLFYIIGLLVYYCYKINREFIKKVYSKLFYRTKQTRNGILTTTSRFRTLTGQKERSMSNVDDGFGDFMDEMMAEGQWRSRTSYYGPPAESAYAEEDNSNTDELPRPVRGGVGHSSFSIDERRISFVDSEQPLINARID